MEQVPLGHSAFVVQICAFPRPVAHVVSHVIEKLVMPVALRQQTCPDAQSAFSSHSTLLPLQVAVAARQVSVAEAPLPALQHSLAGTAHSPLPQVTKPGLHGMPLAGPPGHGVDASDIDAGASSTASRRVDASVIDEGAS